MDGELHAVSSHSTRAVQSCTLQDSFLSGRKVEEMFRLQLQRAQPSVTGKLTDLAKSRVPPLVIWSLFYFTRQIQPLS